MKPFLRFSEMYSSKADVSLPDKRENGTIEEF